MKSIFIIIFNQLSFLGTNSKTTIIMIEIITKSNNNENQRIFLPLLLVIFSASCISLSANFAFIFTSITLSSIEPLI